MPKTKTQYICQQCGRISVRDMGRCPQCNAWNSFVEEVVAAPTPAARGKSGPAGRSEPQRLAQIGGDYEERLPMPIGEFARVLGGGVVPGSLVLIGGDPGIGKSTLLLQVALEMAHGSPVLYVSGEESERQIKMRAARLLRSAGKEDQDFPADLFLVTETDLDTVLGHVTQVKPRLLVVNSIQTTTLQDLEFLRRYGLSGARVRFAAARISQILRHCCLPHRACHQGRRHRRAAGFGAYRRYRPVPGRRPLSILPPVTFREEPLWRNLRSGRVRDARTRPGRSYQSV